MFIKKIEIQNFKIFPSDSTFEVDNLNMPDGHNEGSGLNLFVGENGCGKTSLLDALALPLLNYKAESVSLDYFNNPDMKMNVRIFAKDNFTFKGTMPNQQFKGKGFLFEAGIRSRENRSFLSSIIVTDQKYIRADGETRPEDGKPDLRLNVNNPWSGPRFNENDVLFLDKNRTYQTRTGTYNSTRFDRLMEDFDYQYIKKDDNPIDFNEKFIDVAENIDNQFLSKAIDKFKDVSGEEIVLSLINNWTPHSKGFLSVIKENKQHISIDCLGSGYEMIFSLLYSFYLSQQSGKKLIVLIDEPELHLHPTIQEKFVKILLELSTTAQIFLTTHSPLFVKQLLFNANVQVKILKKNNGLVTVSNIEDRLLSYLSANEVNYIAFDLPTEEYHNELFEELKIRDDNARNAPLNLKDFDSHFFQTEKSETASYPYNGNPNQVSIHTHIRTQIHHRGTAGTANTEEIKSSIQKMRSWM